MKLNLQARLVAAIAQFKATNDIRYYLNGVYVSPRPTGGALIIATNGHSMGLWLDDSGEIERPAILRIGARLQAACQGADTKRLVITDDRLAVISNEGTELHIQPESGKWEVPGTFPDWTRVVREVDGPPCLNSALNAEYIAMIDRAISIGAGNKFRGITMRQSSECDSIIFTSSNAPNFVGVVMPVREAVAPLPGWVKPEKARAGLDQRAKAAPLPVYEPSDAGPPDGDVHGWRLAAQP